MTGSFRRNPLKTLAALLVLVWLATCILSDPRYKVDGQCMTYKAGSITVRTASRGDARSIKYEMPYDDARAVLNMPEGRRALLVGYNDYTPGAYDRARARFVRDASAMSDCPMTPLPDGLSRFGPSEDPACGFRHRIDRADRTTFYRSTDLPPDLGPVEVRCGNDPRVVGCRMTVRLPNDWEASVSLPKSMLDAWQPVAVAASAYFTAHLVHCDRRPHQP